MVKVNILGVDYTIHTRDESEDPILKDNNGYCDFTTKEIVVKSFVPDVMSLKDLDMFSNKVIRHEIVHAFLYESGLHNNSVDCWAMNEEIVDWIALQMPKLHKAMDSAGVLSK